MRSLFRRLRHERITPLEAELLAARPQPPKRLVESIVSMVRPRSGARPARLRLGFASGLTVALVAVAAATGGLSYAATAIVHATRAVHITSAKPSPAPVAAVSSACSQYAVAPIVTHIAPTSAKVGKTVVITGSNFSGDSAIESVTFGGPASASFTVHGDRQVTTHVPTTAHTGGITVSNCKGSATSSTFTVLKNAKKVVCTVPNVIGKTLTQAEAAIKHAHCGVAKVTKVSKKNSKAKHYHVIAQHPKAGTKLSKGSGVSLKARR